MRFFWKNDRLWYGTSSKYDYNVAIYTRQMVVYSSDLYPFLRPFTINRQKSTITEYEFIEYTTILLTGIFL